MASIAVQRASIDQRRTSIVTQRTSIERQLASVAVQTVAAQKQRLSVAKQAAIVPEWKTPVVPEAIIPASFAVDCPPLPATEADALITSAADREALPPELLRAVIKQESGFKPCAVSSAGAQGLMQLMPDTADELRVDDPFDPMQNIRGGAAYLKSLVKRYGGDLRLALSAYNAGMGRVDHFNAVPDLLETQNYVDNITGNLGYTQLPADPVPTAPEVKPDFERLMLPPPASVFPNAPDFKRYQ